MMTLIRRADPTDFPWLLEQLREFAAYFGGSTSLFPTDDEARAFLCNLLDAGHPILIAQNDVRTGFLVGTIGPHPFNSARITAFVLFWWVVPKYRGSMAGGRLLLEFRELARQRGATHLIAALQERTIAEGLIDPSSLVALGFHPQERAYLLELPGVIS
jgi:N-acetylglutamate synthase-like GNAT family acetyltransferase